MSASEYRRSPELLIEATDLAEGLDGKLANLVEAHLDPHETVTPTMAGLEGKLAELVVRGRRTLVDLVEMLGSSRAEPRVLSPAKPKSKVYFTREDLLQLSELVERSEMLAKELQSNRERLPW